MAIVDVFRNISDRILVFHRKWDEVPDKPGVYAWYYPIRIPSTKLSDLIDELRAVRNYDARCQGIPEAEYSIKLNWTQIHTCTTIEVKHDIPPDGVYEAWDQILGEGGETLEDFRKTLLVSSLLMPPLYVGKTSSLRDRCAQHRGVGSTLTPDDNSSFRARFEKFASKNDLIKTATVNDLIMVCVTTSEGLDAPGHHGYKNVRSLVEEILKAASHPPYGMR